MVAVDFLNGKQHGFHPVDSIKVDVMRLLCAFGGFNNVDGEKPAENQVALQV